MTPVVSLQSRVGDSIRVIICIRGHGIWILVPAVWECLWVDSGGAIHGVQTPRGVECLGTRTGLSIRREKKRGLRRVEV